MRWTALLFFCTACPGLLKDHSGDDSETTSAGEGEGEGEGEGDTGLDSWWSDDGTIAAYVMDGEATWTLSFDADAEANGYTDCTYSRTFHGVQVLDLNYLCPDCELIARGVSTMDDGADCFASVFGEDDVGDRVEMWGVDLDGWFYRSGRDQGVMGQLSEITPAEDTDVAITWSSDYTMSAGGAMNLTAAGSLRYAVDETILLDDPNVPRTEPYACGWPQNNPGDLTLDYVLTEGGTFPNVRLEDQCGDGLDLWDLYGSYLVIDTSQPDCGPCRTMASESETFKAEMEDEGIPVYVVSLLGGGLSDPWDTPDEDTYTSWITSYGVTDPLLYDRGFGYAVIPAFAESFTGEDFGYPTWLIVGPDMKLMYANVGFRSADSATEEYPSSFDQIADMLREDWESR